jgi:hypothetical protein
VFSYLIGVGARSRVKSYSRRIVSATLSTTGTRGWFSAKSAKVNFVVALPVTLLPEKSAVPVHVVGRVTPWTVRLPSSVSVREPEVGSAGAIRPSRSRWQGFCALSGALLVSDAPPP